MKKSAPRSVYVCQECGSQSVRWQGRCPDCGQWNTLQEELATPRANLGMALSVAGDSLPVALEQVDRQQEDRTGTGLEELDRVLGGGLVAGSMVLLGGPPGIGKSTLLLQMAQSLALRRAPILYVTGEESPRQIRMRADRLGVSATGILLLAETRLEAIQAQIHSVRPGLVFVDSVQTLFRSDLAPAPGSVTQVRECAASLMRLAKSEGTPIVLVGHVTKDGQIAGPRVLEHLVDTVLYFEGDGMHNVRILRSVKNRFGSTQEVALFGMGAKGLEPIPDASRFFLSQRAAGAPGSLVFPSLEGSRPLLVEVQALVGGERQDNATPLARKSVGIDPNRLTLLVAVLGRRSQGHVRAVNRDVYAKVAGGLKLNEPALDLPVVMAVASSLLDHTLEPTLGCMGEVGLGGEVRAVSQVEARLRELAKLGFSRCILPAPNLEGLERKGLGGMELVGVSNVKQALVAVHMKVQEVKEGEGGKGDGTGKSRARPALREAPDAFRESPEAFCEALDPWEPACP